MATQSQELPAPPPSGTISSDPVAQTLALLQPWIDYVPQRQRRLGLFIFLAFLLHVTAFFFLRIDTTRAELQHQARIHVTVENRPPNASEEVESGDAFWDRLTDPRLFLVPSAPLAGPSSNDASLDFTAVNPSIGSTQLPSPVSAESYPFSHHVVPPLEQSVAEALIPPRQPFFYDEAAPAIATRTTWIWGSLLAQRQPTGVPDLSSPISDTELTPTELRVAVSPDGTVEHVMVEQSGRLDLDQQAILATRKIHFHSTDQPGLLWGRVTIFWHYAATPREEVVPTPSTST